jgi:hypothetical protein
MDRGVFRFNVIDGRAVILSNLCEAERAGIIYSTKIQPQPG